MIHITTAFRRFIKSPRYKRLERINKIAYMSLFKDIMYDKHRKAYGLVVTKRILQLLYENSGEPYGK